MTLSLAAHGSKDPDLNPNSGSSNFQLNARALGITGLYCTSSITYPNTLL